MIPEAWLEELQRRVDLVRLGEQHGVSWQKKQAKRALARCPFHEERTPSFYAWHSPKHGPPRFVCYGSCGRSWSAISFLVDGFGRDFLESIEELSKAAGMVVPKRGETEAAQRIREAKKERRDQIYRAIELAQVYFSKALEADRPEAEKARDYLRGRDLWEAVGPWGFGFAPGGDGLERWLKQQNVPLDVALEACLLGEKDGRIYPFFWDMRVTIPWRDRQGRIVAHVGRTMEPDHEPKYLNPREIPGVFHKGEMVFGLHEAEPHIRQQEEAVLVEGQISAITPWLHGVRNVVACGGKAFSETHARLLQGAGAKRLLLLMDGDPAGRHGARSAVRIAGAEGINTRVVALREGQDPDDYLRAAN